MFFNLKGCSRSVFSSTVVTEWNLVCEGGKGQVMVDLGYSMYSVGVFLGVLIPGYFSDRFGRKKMMFFAMFVSAVSTLVSAFVEDYTSFLVVRVFSGFGTLGTFVSMCILAVEITSVQHKSLVGNLVHILWGPGQMVMALMAYLIRDWRQLHIAVSVPSTESVRQGITYSLCPSIPLPPALPSHPGVPSLAPGCWKGGGGQEDPPADGQAAQQTRASPGPTH